MTTREFTKDEIERVLRYAADQKMHCDHCGRCGWDVWPNPLRAHTEPPLDLILLQCWHCRKESMLLGMGVLGAET